jgi:SAM-dependent methyltransferase
VSAFSAADWQRLRALRDRFLSDASEEYWTPRDLELYDATFARRIGWKWEGMLRLLDREGWRPAATRLLDWGCGTGIASRTVAEWAGIRNVQVFDQSAAAIGFALARLRALGISAAPAGSGEIPADTLLVVSHVAGELSEAELAALAEQAARAEEILWVEPGSREISLRLSRVHDVLRRHGHRLLAPCTQDISCPMNHQDQDWCHFFAEPPGEIYHSPFWRDFSLSLEIDLRALPFSFLAATKRAEPKRLPGAERLIGPPRVLKGHCELLCCGREGLATRILQKRDAPGLFKELSRGKRDGVFVWDHDPAKAGRVRGEAAVG